MKTTTKTKDEAVKVEGSKVTLDVCYCIPDVESDSNTFSEIIGGRDDLTKAQAIKNVIQAAKTWANNMRAEGYDIGVWDAAGNQY